MHLGLNDDIKVTTYQIGHIFTSLSQSAVNCELNKEPNGSHLLLLDCIFVTYCKIDLPM